MKNQTRREFLGKVIGAAALLALDPVEVLINPKDLLAGNGNSPLGSFIVDLTKYPALASVKGSVAISLAGTSRRYPDGNFYKFRFILTRTGDSPAAFSAVDGYCTHKYSVLNPYNGTVIPCSNLDFGHGSQFNLDGTVARKPATKSLEVYQTSYDAAANTVTVIIPELAVTAADVVSHELYQNYPNPAKEKTTIGLKLASSAKVVLKVTDAMGHVIAVLHDGFLNSGENQFDFNTSIFPSGTYFYSLTVDGETLTWEMTIVK